MPELEKLKKSMKNRESLRRACDWGGRPMKTEVPEQLQATRDLLIHSLPSHPQEVVPPVPQGLMEETSPSVFPESKPPRQPSWSK